MGKWLVLALVVSTTAWTVVLGYPVAAELRSVAATISAALDAARR